MQVACHISLERFGRGYNFSLNVTSIRGLHKKLWASKVVRISISRFYGLRVSREKWHLGVVPRVVIENTIRGKVVVFPSLGHGEFCESMYACGLPMHQNYSNYTLIYLNFYLCTSVWIINPLITHFNPPLFSFLDSHLNLSRSVGVCQICYKIVLFFIFSLKRKW